MLRHRFFAKAADSLSLQEVIDLTGFKLLSNVNISSEIRISDVATLQNATQNELSFLSSGQYLEGFKASSAGFCLVAEESVEKLTGLCNPNMILFYGINPYFAYSKVSSFLYRPKFPANEQEEFAQISGAVVHQSSEIGDGSFLMSGSYIGKNVQIGKNCLIYPNATIMDNCILGDDCVIGPGATISFATIGDRTSIFAGVRIGQDGFGFVHQGGVNHKIEQIGLVRIGNDVEIGANSCIDRGAIDDTIIEDGVKIDNLVQIAHNVVIGGGTVIAGCASIAGSTTIGRFVQVGGASAISGHLIIGDGARVAGMSGVIRDVEPKKVVAGIPAVPIKHWHRMNVASGASQVTKITKK